jgi:Serine/threonine protein kinase
MGEVYRARDTRLARDVAVKVLPESLAADAAALSRFEREAKAVAALSHPNILAIHDFGAGEGLTYAVTELLEGETLRSRLARERLAETRIVAIGVALAEGLSAAHSKGIVHRDLKPENVFLTADGRVKILDFGLARQEAIGPDNRETTAPTVESPTEPGTVLGTVGYMSPEQVRGAPAGARSDIFSLGCVLYEMAAGARPFVGATAAETLAAILRDPPAPARERDRGISTSLERVITRCLEKSPEERFQTASDLAFALKEAGSSPSLAAAPPPRPRPRAGWMLVAGLSLAVLAAFGLLYLPGRSRRAGGSGVPRARSLAVLPIENRSGDPAQDLLADGLTEGLITDLGKISALRVISRSSVVPFKGSKKTVREIARDLNVDAIVEGGIQRSGGERRINVEVIDASSGFQLWAQPFDQKTDDLFGLQNRISRAIVAALKLPLTAAEEQGLRRAPTSNLEAYDFYLRGKLHSRRENREDNAAAIEMLEKAVALDPAFAAAHAELAHAYHLKVFYFTPQDKQASERAFLSAEKALSLDPELAEAHYARASLLWTPANHFPHEQAAQEYRRAIALNPNLDDAHHQLGLIDMHIGLFEKASEEYRKALAIDPGNTLARHRTGVVLLYQCRFEEALKILQDTPREFNPSLWSYHVAWALLHLGRRQEASAVLDKFFQAEREDRGGVVASMRAMLFATQGDALRAEQDIRRAEEAGKGFGHFHHAAYNMGVACALLDQPAPALRWLRAAADNGFPCYPLFAKDPYLDRIRGNPEFAAFLSEMKTRWEDFQTRL